MSDLIEAQNQTIVTWTEKMKSQILPASISSAGIKPSGGSRAFKLGRKYGKERSTGGINRIGFTMAKHGVYREKGVGRGRGINSGKTIKPPWFNPAIDKNIEQLADDIATITGDVIATEKVRIR